MNFLRSNFWELERSPRLYHFSMILAILHIINYGFWSQQSHLLSATGSHPLLCWGFFESCARDGFLATISSKLLFTLYLIVSVLALLASIWRRSAFATWILVFIMSALHLFFYVFDASLAQDVHGLLLFLEIGYLFVPNKLTLVRASVVIFHLILAWRELTPDWLSGAGMSESLPFPLKGLEWIAGMGIAIKMTLPFLLVSTSGQRLALGAVGLLVYHGFLFYFRQDFSSLALMALVAFFVLDHIARKKMEFETLYQSYAHPEPSKLWWPMAVGAYALLQIPHLSDSSPMKLLAIVGPPMALECQHVNFANSVERVDHLTDILPKELTGKARCHPLVAFNLAKDTCARLKKRDDFRTLTSAFLSRRPNEEQFTTVFMIDDICPETVTYRSVVSR